MRDESNTLSKRHLHACCRRCRGKKVSNGSYKNRSGRSQKHLYRDAKARKWNSAEYEDVKVQVYGDVAIATGGYKGKGTDSAKPFDEHLR
jgi:hypothetical protein